MAGTYNMSGIRSRVRERAMSGRGVSRVARRVGERELLPRCRGHPYNPSRASAGACRTGWLAIGFGPVCVRAL